MTDVIFDDPIHQSIFESLTAAETVCTALLKLKGLNGLTDDQLAEIADLNIDELSAESFSREQVKDLRAFGHSLEPAILNETRTWFVHEECDTSGGHVEKTRTDVGYALDNLQFALLTLADQLSHTVALQETEKVLISLRR